MPMSEQLHINGYITNGPEGAKPRRPIVHLIASDEYGGVHGISFHPNDAAAVISAITKATNAAKRGRKSYFSTLKLRPHG